MINIKFTADPLPSDFTGTLQDMQTRFLTNLRGTIDNTAVLTGQVGGPAPVSDVGPWLNGTTWHVWNGSEYVPSAVKVGSAGYVIQLGDYTTVGSSKSLLPDRVQTLQDKDGTVALLSDVYVRRTPVVLSGTTPTIDGNLSSDFTQTLSGNTTVKVQNIQQGQTVYAALRNNATSYSVTWSATPAIFWPSGSAPSQTALKTDLYILKNIGGSLLGRQIPNYS